MDPKAINNMDPKLKETYDRVMGTTTPGSSTAVPSATTTQPVTAASGMPASPMPPPPSTPSTRMDMSSPATPAYNADNLRFQAAIQTPLTAPTAAPVSTGMPAAKMPGQSSSLLRVLYIILAMVFFVVYTFVWIKIFNLPLPF